MPKLTVAQAARELGVTRQAVWSAIDRGRIKAEKLGPILLIPYQSLQSYKSSRSHSGPRKNP